MARATLQDRYATALRHLGFVEDPNARTRKYRVFAKPDTDSRNADLRVYLGKAGAVRVGPTISRSFASERYKHRLLRYAP